MKTIVQKIHLFGDLEGDIMEILWKRESGSVREVLSELSKKRVVAYTTAMTVMSRLHEKGLLVRFANDAGGYTYAPKERKERFLASASREFIQSIIKEFGPVAVAQFMDIMRDSDKKQKDELRRELAKIKTGNS